MLTVDNHTAEILGIHAAKRATRSEALEPVRKGRTSTLRGHPGGMSSAVWSRARATDRNTSAPTLIAKSVFWESYRVRLLCVPRKVSAASSGRSAGSRNSCCGLRPLRPLKICEPRCCNGPSCTTNSGSSSVAASSRPFSAGASITLKLKRWLHERSD
jgi:hypothetical protein